MSKSSRGVVSILAILLWLPVAALAQKSKLPVLKSISPTSTNVPGSSFTLTVTGSGFTSGSVVQWNGGARTTTIFGSTQLQAQISSADVANAGTAQVTVSNPGRNGGTSAGLSFTINPAPTPPTTSTSTPTTTSTTTTPTTTSTTTTTTTTTTTSTIAALAITTTSVPGGALAVNYSTTLAGSGGSPAYTWSIPTGGGSLPPGLALTAAGAITGNPNAAGTFSFTAQATDTAGQVAQKAFSLDIAAPPPSTTTPTTTSSYLFQEGFENGTFAAWAPTQIWVNMNPQITTALTHSGTHAYEQYYYVCGDSANSACLGPIQDVNRFIYTIFDSTHNNSPQGLTHFFVRAYVYFKHPEPDGSLNLMRKLIWINDAAPGTWSSLLKVDGDTTGVMKFTYGSNGSTACGMQQFNAFTGVGSISYDTWYSVEEEIQLNTPGVNDGIVRLWVNGDLIAESTTFSLRGTCSTTTNMVSFGRQAQRSNYNPINEYRYYDDIVISNSYIGP